MKILTIFYDNYCPNCTKFASIIKKLDWMNLLNIRKLRNKLDANLFSDIDLELAKKQMASFGSKWHYGYNSIYFIFLRIPLFWLFIPFFYILKVTKLGQFMYVEFALKRKIIPIHCDAEICKLTK